MNILFITYGFPPHGLAGACVYHHELAKLLLKHGNAIIVASKSCMEPYTIDGIKVAPLALHDKFSEWADAIITVPSLSVLTNHKNVIAIQHTVSSVDHPKANKFIYCAEHLQGMYEGPSMVWRPMMRLTPAKKRRKLKDRPVIGFINNSIRKGGLLIEPVAKAFPSYLVKVIEFKGDKMEFQRPELPNIEYTNWNLNDVDSMDKWMDSIDVMVLRSDSEGYSTVALECLAKGIPCVASPIPGIREPLSYSTCYCFENNDFLDSIMDTINDNYSLWSLYSLEQWEQVKDLNDIRKLITFIN
jgi:glycosyltransferase involved in cell wall biosynthesis